MNAFESDDDLADAVRRGDVVAQEEFFNRFRLTLIKFPMSRRFSESDAEDLAQETLEVGYQKIASFRRGESLKRWLVGIELNFMRRRWAEPEVETVPLRPDEAGVVRRAEESKALARFWAQTQLNMEVAKPKRYIDAVRLRYLDELDYEEVERALNLSKNSGKVYVQRGLRILKEMSEADVPPIHLAIQSQAMSNPMDRSLHDMRRDNEDSEEMVEKMVVEEIEQNELEELGNRLTQAYRLSGEPPSLAAIELAEASVSLSRAQEERLLTFNAGVRSRIRAACEESADASSIGEWIERARHATHQDEAGAARTLGIATPAYRQFIAGRMPVWRLPVDGLVRLCRALSLDLRLLIRWSSVSGPSASQGVYGRLDVADDDRSDELSQLADESERNTSVEFSAWQSELIAAASPGASKGDAPSER